MRTIPFPALNSLPVNLAHLGHSSFICYTHTPVHVHTSVHTHSYPSTNSHTYFTNKCTIMASSQAYNTAMHSLTGTQHTHTHTHTTHTHTLTYTRMHTRTHALMNTRKHTPLHTHTHSLPHRATQAYTRRGNGNLNFNGMLLWWDWLLTFSQAEMPRPPAPCGPGLHRGGMRTSSRFVS